MERKCNCGVVLPFETASGLEDYDHEEWCNYMKTPEIEEKDHTKPELALNNLAGDIHRGEQTGNDWRMNEE